MDAQLKAWLTERGIGGAGTGGPISRLFAALGQRSLSGYLTQSVVFLNSSLSSIFITCFGSTPAGPLLLFS